MTQCTTVVLKRVIRNIPQGQERVFREFEFGEYVQRRFVFKSTMDSFFSYNDQMISFHNEPYHLFIW